MLLAAAAVPGLWPVSYTHLGPFTVGDNARIAAGAVVLTAVPAGATAVGVPARVVRMDGVPVRYADAVDQIHVEDPVCRELDSLRERLAQLEELMEHQTHTKERTA